MPLYSVTIRQAQSTDAQQVFEWRNLPEIVGLSEGQKTVTWEEHKNWFEKAVYDEQKIIFLINIDGTDSGLIRFDRGEGVNVGIYLVGEHKNKGYGQYALKLALDKVHKIWNPEAIEARIRADNEVSRNFFSKLGFVFARNDGQMVIYRYES